MFLLVLDASQFSSLLILRLFLIVVFFGFLSRPAKGSWFGTACNFNEYLMELAALS